MSFIERCSSFGVSFISVFTVYSVFCERVLSCVTWSDTPMVHVTCTYQRSSHDKATGCSCTCGCSQLPVVNAKTFSIMAQSTSEAKSLFHKKLSVKLLVFVASRAVELLFFGCHCCNSQPKRNRPPLFDIFKSSCLEPEVCGLVSVATTGRGCCGF